MASSPPVVIKDQLQTKPAKTKNRHVFITERKRDKLAKRLSVARQEGDWKLEAQVLMQIGQVLKWRGQESEGGKSQAQAASILRAHTFAHEASEAT